MTLTERLAQAERKRQAEYVRRLEDEVIRLRLDGARRAGVIDLTEQKVGAHGR
jgi:hypothetical protein